MNTKEQEVMHRKEEKTEITLNRRLLKPELKPNLSTDNYKDKKDWLAKKEKRTSANYALRIEHIWVFHSLVTLTNITRPHTK